MTTVPTVNPDLPILEQIEQDPDANQATLATRLDVAVGTINWHLKRLIDKGYVKVRRMERKKLRYLITPDGIALRARLTIDYINNQFSLYRLVRQRMQETILQLKSSGMNRVRLVGDGDVAEVCRLSCGEHGITIVEDEEVPSLVIRGLKIFIE